MPRPVTSYNYRSARRERRAQAAADFRALIVDMAEQPLHDDEILTAWTAWGGDHRYALKMRGDEDDDGVAVDVCFIGVTPMVAWSASGYVRTIQSADGYIALKKADPATLLANLRAARAEHRRVLAERKAAALDLLNLKDSARARLGFWQPNAEDHDDLNAYWAARRAFAFDDLQVYLDGAEMRFRVKPQALDRLTADQVIRLKSLLDRLAEDRGRDRRAKPPQRTPARR